MGLCHGSRASPASTCATLAVVGMDNSGKSTTVLNLVKNYHGLVTPTLGFSCEKLQIDNRRITLYDLGGSQAIRGYWTNYYHEVFGLIFVVDSATSQTAIQEAAAVLHATHEDPRIRGKPLLIFANKQDLPSAHSPDEVASMLRLDALQNCRFHIEKCTAYVKHDGGEPGPGAAVPDANIPKGLQWLLDAIDKDYEAIAERVHRDTAEWQQQQLQQRREQQQRVTKYREAREATTKTTTTADAAAADAAAAAADQRGDARSASEGAAATST